jgi:hypothetical protein
MYQVGRADLSPDSQPEAKKFSILQGTRKFIVSIATSQNTLGSGRILEHSSAKSLPYLTAIILPKPPILATPLALLNLLNNLSRSHSLASEEVILHLVARAACTRETASVLHFSLILAFVFALVLAKTYPRESFVSWLRTHLDQRASTVVVVTVAEPGGYELGKHCQSEADGD